MLSGPVGGNKGNFWSFHQGPQELSETSRHKLPSYTQIKLDGNSNSKKIQYSAALVLPTSSARDTVIGS